MPDALSTTYVHAVVAATVRLVKLVKAVGACQRWVRRPLYSFFSKSFDAGAQIEEVSVRLIQGIIPDMAIGARDCNAGPYPKSYRWRQKPF